LHLGRLNLSFHFLSLFGQLVTNLCDSGHCFAWVEELLSVAGNQRQDLIPPVKTVPVSCQTSLELHPAQPFPWLLPLRDPRSGQAAV